MGGKVIGAGGIMRTLGLWIGTSFPCLLAENVRVSLMMHNI